MHVTGAKRGEIVGEKLSYYCWVKSLTQVLGHLQRTDTVKTRVEGPIIAWENSWHLATLPLVSRQMTSEKRAQKFHTDDASLPRSG